MRKAYAERKTMYYLEDSGVYRKCIELEKSVNMMLPFNDLCINWQPFFEGKDIVAGGARIIVQTEGIIELWEERVARFSELFSLLKSMTMCAMDDTPRFVKSYLSKERRRPCHDKQLVVDITAGGESFVEEFKKELLFWRKVQHLVEWCCNIDKTHDHGRTFLFLGVNFGLPEGSFGYALVRNFHLNFDQYDFIETLDHDYRVKDHEHHISGGLTKDNDGRWHSST